MKSQFDNKIKAATRSVVLSYFRKWSRPLLKKTTNITAYTLPADIWELEQSMIHDVIDSKKMCSLYLKCFESNQKTFDKNVDSRRFMLDGVSSNDNLTFDYEKSLMHHNMHAKKNFFMWADFCGYPTKERLDMLLHPKNFVGNSLVFATFASRWRKCYTIPSQLKKMCNSMFRGSYYQSNKLAHHASNAIENYILQHNNVKGCNVFPVVNVEYMAGNGVGSTPMCLLGFSNSTDLAKFHPFRIVLNWFKNPTRQADREVLNRLHINTCLNQ